ncbi:hypothetical protein HN385_04290 [archaeon]|nr:hypothetical protein [archaeon]MBT3450462.1 hypothetical protein [archaeon]MBT6868981.1 hypothetical protein [archaeon]MBT7193247.1 hypothetical protein [archaeon]MBT7380102.1 hypothetical protein [archaeon]
MAPAIIQPKKSIIITHGEDIDGIVSGALMLKQLEDQDREILFFTHDNKLNLLEQISDQPNLNSKHTYILDLALSDLIYNHRNKEGERVIRKLLEQPISSTWIDHHQRTLNLKEKVVTFGTNLIDDNGEELCTSRLVYQHFLHGNDYANWLSHLAQIDDYKKTKATEKDQLISQQLTKIISLHNSNMDNNSLEILAKKLGKKESWFIDEKISRDLVMSLESYQLKEKKALQYIEQNLEQYQAQGLKILVSYADPILPQKTTIRNMTNLTGDKNQDIYVLVFGKPVNNIWLLYKGDQEKFDILNFLSSQNGGGRVDFGGFPTSQDTNLENYQQEKELFIEKVRKHIIKK